MFFFLLLLVYLPSNLYFISISILNIIFFYKQQIWGKVICMERNRRIAKAYSRNPILIIDGSLDQGGFDGERLGLNSFENPMRDSLTKTVKSHIGKVSTQHPELISNNFPSCRCVVNRINHLIHLTIQ